MKTELITIKKIWHLQSFLNGVHTVKQRISAIDCPDAIVVKDAIK